MITWRTLPALALVAAGFLPATPASAGDECLYYRWFGDVGRWERVAVSDEDVYEKDHVRYVDWDCKYCYVQLLQHDPGDPSLLAAVVDFVDGAAGPTAEPVVRPVADAGEMAVATVVRVAGQLDVTIADPFDGPECPDVPPEWDAF